MSKKYSDDLITQIHNKQHTETIDGLSVVVKEIPDLDIEGAMDPRLYKSQRKLGLLLRFLPKKIMNMDITPENIDKMRIPFNKVDSTSFVEGVNQTTYSIPSFDKVPINIHVFKDKDTLENAPILYFIHGGGFFAGSTEVVAEFLRYIVRTTHIIAVSVDYRLAPEHAYPKGHKDTYVGLNWTYEHAHELGGDPKRIFVAGDSAGGNLTLYCANQNIKEGKDMIKGQALIYPTVNMANIKDAYYSFDINKYSIYEKQRYVIEPMLKIFKGAMSSLGDIMETDNTHTLELSPYLEVSEKMPPTFITCGEHDALLLESIAYARKLKDKNVPVFFSMYKGMGHAYIDQMGNFPQAEDFAIDLGNFILET